MVGSGQNLSVGIGSGITVLLNDGSSDPNFTEVVVPNETNLVHSIQVTDVNNDGKNDILATNSYDGQVMVFSGELPRENHYLSVITICRKDIIFPVIIYVCHLNAVD